MKKRLISSYDEENDTFLGKVDGENGYVADYGISDEVYLGINNSNLPTSCWCFQQYAGTASESRH